MGKSTEAISDKTRTLVLDRALNAQGDVCCAFCQSAIEANQLATLQHIVPFSYINRPLPEIYDAFNMSQAQRLAFSNMPDNQRSDALQNYFNRIENLCPMHAACHATADADIEKTRGRPMHSEGRAKRVNHDSNYAYRNYDEHAAALVNKLLTKPGQPIGIDHIRMPVLLRYEQRLRDYDDPRIAEELEHVHSVIDKRTAAAKEWPPTTYNRPSHIQPGRYSPANPDQPRTQILGLTAVQEGRWLVEATQETSPENFAEIMRAAATPVLATCAQQLTAQLSDLDQKIQQAQQPLRTAAGTILRGTHDDDRRKRNVKSLTVTRSHVEPQLNFVNHLLQERGSAEARTI